MRQKIQRALAFQREGAAVVEQAMLVARSVAGLRLARPASVPARRTVLFVHGFFAAGPVFDPMRRHVERTLDVATADFTYGPIGRFEDVAERFALLADRHAGHGPIDLVGHSLGGLLARWYLQELGGARHAQRLVTLATPHAGTEAARIAPSGLGHALRPGSRVVRRLAETRHKARGVAHTAIVAGADRMITPPASASAIDDATVHWFDELGHNEMLFDRAVYGRVTDALAAEPSAASAIAAALSTPEK
jgi:triacylglycerol esterase/lipase EstA (alpha/beta hydrolase family)